MASTTPQVKALQGATGQGFEQLQSTDTNSTNNRTSNVGQQAIQQRELSPRNMRIAVDDATRKTSYQSLNEDDYESLIHFINNGAVPEDAHRAEGLVEKAYQEPMDAVDGYWNKMLRMAVNSGDITVVAATMARMEKELGQSVQFGRFYLLQYGLKYAANHFESQMADLFLGKMKTMAETARIHPSEMEYINNALSYGKGAVIANKIAYTILHTALFAANYFFKVLHSTVGFKAASTAPDRIANECLWKCDEEGEIYKLY